MNQTITSPQSAPLLKIRSVIKTWLNTCIFILPTGMQHVLKRQMPLLFRDSLIAIHLSQKLLTWPFVLGGDHTARGPLLEGIDSRCHPCTEATAAAGTDSVCTSCTALHPSRCPLPTSPAKQGCQQCLAALSEYAIHGEVTSR